MNGEQHFIIGATTVGLGLWGTRAVGLQVETETILAGALIAGLGSLAPDIDHPRSTISRGLPTELLLRGLAFLLLPVVFAVIPAMFGDFHSASRIFQSLSPFVQWGLILIAPAIVLIAISIIVSAFFGHRGATHSLIFAAGATFIATVICVYSGVTWWYGLLFGWGWLSHLLADATTEMGLPSLLWPFVND